MQESKYQGLYFKHLSMMMWERHVVQRMLPGEPGKLKWTPLKKSPYLEPVYKGGVATKNVSEFDIYFEQSAFICASWSVQYLSYLYISDQ